MKQQMQARMPAAAPLGSVAVLYRLNRTASRIAVATWRWRRWRWRERQRGVSGCGACRALASKRQPWAYVRRCDCSHPQCSPEAACATQGPHCRPSSTHHAGRHDGVAAEQQRPAPHAVHQPDGDKGEGPQRAAHDGRVDQRSLRQARWRGGNRWAGRRQLPAGPRAKRAEPAARTRSVSASHARPAAARPPCRQRRSSTA